MASLQCPAALLFFSFTAAASVCHAERQPAKRVGSAPSLAVRASQDMALRSASRGQVD